MPGGAESRGLRDLPLPGPAACELRVRVRACAINYPDVLIIEDRYQFKPPRPFSPGVELCGVVDEIGKDVEGWHRGDVLLATCSHGGLAEYCVVPAGNAFRQIGRAHVYTPDHICSSSMPSSA